MGQIGMESRSSYYTSRKHLETTDTDRVMVFLLLAEVHIHFNHFPEATKTIQDAMTEFSGIPEEVKYTAPSLSPKVSVAHMEWSNIFC